ncbi:hypothetical protein FHY18_004487 [Xanthomonas arboricola]|nr:hypothetical protein [Xanthomonas sp. 3793]
MAIYHTRIKTYSRAKGHSAIAAAACRGGYLLTDPTSGARHDYRGRAGIIQSRCLALSTPRNSMPAKTRGLRLMLITELGGR